MFSIRKNWILNTLGILSMPHKFWYWVRFLIFISIIRCFTQADHVWNESTSSTQVLIQEWFHDEPGTKIYVKFNVLIVSRNDVGHASVCWWVTLFVRVSYWGQVPEMTFGSISFGKLLKIVSFPASWVIYNEDAMLLYYHICIYFPE